MVIFKWFPLVFLCWLFSRDTFTHDSSAIKACELHLILSVRLSVPVCAQRYLPTQQQPITAIASQKRKKRKRRNNNNNTPWWSSLFCIDGGNKSCTMCVCMYEWMCHGYYIYTESDSPFLPPYTYKQFEQNRISSECCIPRTANSLFMKKKEGNTNNKSKGSSSFLLLLLLIAINLVIVSHFDLLTFVTFIHKVVGCRINRLRVFIFDVARTDIFHRAKEEKDKKKIYRNTLKRRRRKARRGPHSALSTSLRPRDWDGKQKKKRRGGNTRGREPRWTGPFAHSPDSSSPST